MQLLYMCIYSSLLVAYCTLFLFESDDATEGVAGTAL